MEVMKSIVLAKVGYMQRKLFTLLLTLLFASKAITQQPDIKSEWSGTFADSFTNGSMTLYFIQDNKSHVTGTYVKSNGFNGKINGQVDGAIFSFTFLQTNADCIGTYGGSIQLTGTTGTGTFEGNDCKGEHKNGVITVLFKKYLTDVVVKQEVATLPNSPIVSQAVENKPSSNKQYNPRSGPSINSDYDDNEDETKFFKTIKIPSDYGIDLKLGNEQQAKHSAIVHEGTLYTEGNVVMQSLITSPKVADLPYKWKFGIETSEHINASSTSHGTIVVNEPLAKMIAGSSGYWAAVLSHEIEHTARRHGVRMYLYEQNYQQQLAYYQVRLRAGDKNANWSIIGLRIGYGIGVKKLSREQEHDADKQGMLLMARAGYHPDFVFALHKMLATNTGDQGKFTAFFSDHPRWATRDERNQRAYDKALGVYSQMWPDAAESPGGLPPTVAFMGKPKSNEDKQNHRAEIQIPIYCRNAKEPIALNISFTDDGGMAPKALINEYMSKDGLLNISKEQQCPSNSDGNISFILPSGVVLENQRKLKAQIMVFDSTHRLIERSNIFEVKIPK